jgi:hypothetical protein
MPASLSEAFGDTYQSNNDTNKKRNKKKVSEYGHRIPEKRYISSNEQKRTVNVSSGGIGAMDDELDAQYLQIDNDCEYGPTDYNIKPKDIKEYMSQLDNIPQDFHPNNINDSTNYIVDPNSVFRPQQQPSQQPQPSQQQQPLERQEDTKAINKKLSSADDARLQEFNAKLDLILQKLGHFDEPAQENVHDIILFVIFGVFIIFILDSVYRVGKMTV